MADRAAKRGAPWRGLLAVATAVAASGAVLAFALPAALCGGAWAAGPPSAASQEAGMVPGLPFRDPPDLNTATPPDLRVRLVARRTIFDLAGKRVWGDSYNGSFVGPTLHAVPGEHVDLTLLNELPVTTNLHFHGMEISPEGDSDNVFLHIAPGTSFTYRLAIPANHPQGTFWYHDHAMSAGMGGAYPGTMPGMLPTATVGADPESEVFAGLGGTILVGDDRSLLPPALRDITAHTLVFKDVQIDRSGRIVQNASDATKESINSDNPAVRLVNGELRPVLTMRPGETQLWRLVNEGADIFYSLRLDGYRFTVIGEDGVPVARITTVGSLLLPPAKRYDVLVTAGPHPGSSWLRTLAYSNGPQGDSYPAVPLMRLRVAGTPARPVPMPAGAMPTAPASLASAPIARHRTVTLSEAPGGAGAMYINGKQFLAAQPVFSTPAVAGTVEQWTILNTTGEVHPFHLHTNHFQVMSANGVPQPYHAMQDIVPVPCERNGVPGKVVIRIVFTYPGKWMFHCHIEAHADAGMMSYINVVKAGSAGSGHAR